MKVLVVDDSALVRRIVARSLRGRPNIHVVDVAADAYQAREKIAAAAPDVVVLDLEMPNVDGLQFLQKLMKHFPLPTIVFSGSADSTRQRAMRLGAVDVVQKPDAERFASAMDDLYAAICRAGRTKAVETKPQRKWGWRSTDIQPLLAIGSSTGGPAAVEAVLKGLSTPCPPIVLAQHMPARYLISLAERLNRVTPFAVKLAADGEALARDHVYIAPGDFHLTTVVRGSLVFGHLTSGPKVQFQRPSVDVLFESVAKMGKAALGVILTGMGSDGAAGLKKMRDAGAYCIGQDERSSTVYGMAREAAALGALDESLPLAGIGPAIQELLLPWRGTRAA